MDYELYNHLKIHKIKGLVILKLLVAIIILSFHCIENIVHSVSYTLKKQ